jgi:hypothetical protein
MSRIPALVHGAWLGASLPAYVRFGRALHAPERAQAAVLQRIVQGARRSALGQKYGLDRVDSAVAFRARVPESRYEDYQPYIEAIRRGEAHVLTGEAVERLVPTAGSTAARKLIPYTRGLRREMNQALGAWIGDLFSRRPALMGGPAYWSVSPAMDVDEDAAVPIGFDSDAAYLGRALEPLMRHALVAPDVLRHARPLASFRYATLRLLLGCAELRLISVWHPSFFALLWQQRGRWFERLVRDVHDGTLSPEEPLPAQVMDGLRRRLRADRGRARALERLGPEARPGAVWPRLDLLSAWGDAAAERPLAALERELGGVEVQRKGLLSTEAFVSIPFGPWHLLAVTAHFVELRDDAGRLVLAHEAEREGEYEVVVTTSGGLYRYRTGDRVRVEGFVGQTPSVRFLGRGDQVVDQVGEKLHEAFVVEALGHALADGAARGPRFAMLAPDPDRAGYTLYVDRAPGPDARARLEEALRENPHYAYARDLGQLGALRLFVVEGNAEEAYLERRHALGSALGDIKPAALSTAGDWATVFRGQYVETP